MTATVAVFALLAIATPSMAQSVAPPGAAACSGCHAPSAIGTALPTLQGRKPEGVAAAMEAFRKGQLPATVMDRIAKGFTDEETRAIAAWVTQQR